MTLHTAFKPQPRSPGNTVVRMQGVSVQYRLPQERIPSIKEYVIRWLKGQVRYHKFWALNNINLEIQRGEVFGIIGPNGAGKSTLLKVIARVLRPTRGAVQIYGRVAPLLELGAGFDYELTGRENIYLNGAILGYSTRLLASRMDNILEFAGLKDFADAPLRTYSTGMVARLGFTVATDQRPDILIVDEILSVGDAEFQTKSFERIQNYQAEGTTILLVSHSLAKVEEICSRAMWLDHGNIVTISSGKAVVDRYLRKVKDEEAERLELDREQKVAQKLQRHGSRKVEITRVRIMDGSGSEQTIFKTGDRVVLIMDYATRMPVSSPVFGIAIFRQDGVHITGPNTGFANVKLPDLNGTGTVTYTIPYLPLLDGLYHFSVAVVNQEDTEIFDLHDRVYPLRVDNRGSTTKERYGLLTLRGEWEHTAGGDDGAR